MYMTDPMYAARFEQAIAVLCLDAGDFSQEDERWASELMLRHCGPRQGYWL